MKTYTEREVIELGVQMRRAQQTYFRDRDKTALNAAKRAETAFDMAAAQIIARPVQKAQAELFEDGGE